MQVTALDLYRRQSDVLAMGMRREQTAVQQSWGKACVWVPVICAELQTRNAGCPVHN